MGETWDDLAKNASKKYWFGGSKPESVPLNALVPLKGTPLENQPLINPLENMVRMVATTRILLPKTRVGLSAGRKTFLMKLNSYVLQWQEQAQYFMVTPFSQLKIMR